MRAMDGMMEKGYKRPKRTKIYLTIEILTTDRIPESVQKTHRMESISVRLPSEASCPGHDHREIVQPNTDLRRKKGCPESEQLHEKVQGWPRELWFLVCVHADLHQSLDEPGFDQGQEDHDDVAVEDVGGRCCVAEQQCLDSHRTRRRVKRK